MTGRDILNIAKGEIGVKEKPANSNRVKYNTWYYGKEVSGSAYPWCMAFVQWVYAQGRIPLPLKTPSCGALLRWYKEYAPDCLRGVSEAREGDVVIFDLPGGADTDHCGILEGVGTSTVTTVDGNTGSGNDANGGAVLRRTRSLTYVAGIIHPWALAEERFDSVADVEKRAPWAKETVERFIERGVIRGGGRMDKNGKPADMDLTRDMLRMLVFLDRATG